jgi:hypothetical protein
MRAIVFKCPATGANVQGWLADDTSGKDDAFVSMPCPACSGVHFVQPKTGKTLGERRLA